MTNRIVKIILIMLICVGFTTTVFAAKPIIRSDSSSFDVSTGMYLLKGNVYVEVNNRVITADEAKVSILSLEVWGSGGITLTQDDIAFSGNSVYVNGPKDNALIKGDIKFKRGNILICADEAEYNWKTKMGTFRNNVSIDDNGQVINTNWLSYDLLANSYKSE